MLDKLTEFYSNVLTTNERIYLLYLSGVLVLGWYLWARNSTELTRTRQELEVRKIVREALRDEG
jgi:hypothetical protein